MTLCSTFGERFREAISEMTSTEASIKLGISKQSVSAYLSGVRKPKFPTLCEFARILNVSPDWLSGKNVPKFPEQKTKHGVIIPVYGRVCAGLPAYAVEDIIDEEEITDELASSGDFIALQVKGDSMEPLMFTGDIVIICKQPDAESGDIVVALVGGEDATVKRLQKHKNGVSLIAQNPAYEPLFYSNKQIEELPVTIIGKVIELRRKL